MTAKHPEKCDWCGYFGEGTFVGTEQGLVCRSCFDTGQVSVGLLWWARKFVLASDAGDRERGARAAKGLLWIARGKEQKGGRP